MNSKWHGTTCPVCMKGTLHDGVRRERLSYKGRVYEYDQRGAFCDRCDDGIVEHDAREEAAWLAFRDRVDREEAADLVRIRRKLKLTQAEAAKLTGGGKNAFSRYERGEVKPMPAVINLFRLLDRHPELLDELRSSP